MRMRLNVVLLGFSVIFLGIGVWSMFIGGSFWDWYAASILTTALLEIRDLQHEVEFFQMLGQLANDNAELVKQVAAAINK